MCARRSRSTSKKNVPVIYMPNTKNDIFQLIYVYDLGTYADSLLQFAPALIGYCGTNDMTPEQVKNVLSRFITMGVSWGLAILSSLGSSPLRL